MSLTTDRVTDLHLVGAGASSQCFPFYTYSEDGTNRRENITDWALTHFRSHYADPSLTKWDIFHYVYAVLHHPTYRERFAEVLKKELPRVPLLAGFADYIRAGRELAEVHVGYESVEPFAGPKHDWKEGKPVSWRVEKMRLTKDRTALVVNESLTLTGIPAEVFGYRLGNRSAVEWVVDQYQVDPRTGEDPNRPDDPEYIVNLVRRVVAVSLRTVSLVAGLPPWPDSPPSPDVAGALPP